MEERKTREAWRLEARVMACCESEALFAALDYAAGADSAAFEAAGEETESGARSRAMGTAHRLGAVAEARAGAAPRAFLARIDCLAAKGAGGPPPPSARRELSVWGWEERGRPWADPDAVAPRDKAERLALRAAIEAERERGELEGELPGQGLEARENRRL